MNYKPFPKDFWLNIESTLKSFRTTSPHQTPVAAFDADGTLWDTDLGENFFQYQIDRQLVPLPQDPFQFYLDKKKENNDPRPAYAWLAQINQGLSLNQVQQWADEAFAHIQPVPIFPEQKKLIHFLLDNNVDVYIVTASIKWAVEPGARTLGLKNENVIGIETAVVNNIISTEVVHPITYRQGKAEALLQKTKGQKPFLASGNTSGDIELLECATHLRLAVSAASRDDRLFKSEKELMDLATAKQWLHHRFI